MTFSWQAKTDPEMKVFVESFKPRSKTKVSQPESERERCSGLTRSCRSGRMTTLSSLLRKSNRSKQHVGCDFAGVRESRLVDADHDERGEEEETKRGGRRRRRKCRAGEMYLKMLLECEECQQVAVKSKKAGGEGIMHTRTHVKFDDSEAGTSDEEYEDVPKKQEDGEKEDGEGEAKGAGEDANQAFNPALDDMAYLKAKVSRQ